MHCRMFGSIPGLYPLGASTTPPGRPLHAANLESVALCLADSKPLPRGSHPHCPRTRPRSLCPAGLGTLFSDAVSAPYKFLLILLLLLTTKEPYLVEPQKDTEAAESKLVLGFAAFSCFCTTTSFALVGVVP